jgi:hypothetical protein
MKHIILAIIFISLGTVYALTPTPTVTPTSVPTPIVQYDDKTGIYYTDTLGMFTCTLTEIEYKENYSELNKFALIDIPTSQGRFLVIRGVKKDLEKLIKDFLKVKPVKKTDEVTVKSKFINYDYVKDKAVKILETTP